VSSGIRERLLTLNYMVYLPVVSAHQFGDVGSALEFLLGDGLRLRQLYFG